MSDKQTGGLAFPANELNRVSGNVCGQHIGLTVRDYFAAKAMQIMWDAYDKGYCGITIENEFNNDLLADGAYQIADAMLKAREA